jgi:predicted DNA-binding transcriptional regulator AlpA
MNPSPARSGRPRMRTKAAAVYAGLGKSTLEKLRVTGDGPQYMRIGKAVVYDPDELDRWAASKVQQSTAENHYTRRRAARPPQPHAAE